MKPPSRKILKPETLSGVFESEWQALEDPFFGGEYFENSEQLEEPKFVILEE